ESRSAPGNRCNRHRIADEDRRRIGRAVAGSRSGSALTADEAHQFATLVGRRQSSLSRQRIVAHVLWIAGAGNRTRDRGMRDDEFQKCLRPARGERLSKRWKWLRARVREQSAALKRPIDENTQAQVAREWKHAIRRVAYPDRVRELHEVGL